MYELSLSAIMLLNEYDADDDGDDAYRSDGSASL